MLTAITPHPTGPPLGVPSTGPPLGVPTGSIFSMKYSSSSKTQFFWIKTSVTRVFF